MAKRLKQNSVRPKAASIDSAGKTLPTAEGQSADHKRVLAQHDGLILEVTKSFRLQDGKYVYIGVRFKKVRA